MSFCSFLFFIWIHVVILIFVQRIWISALSFLASFFLVPGAYITPQKQYIVKQMFSIFLLFHPPALLDEVGFNFMRKAIAAIEARGEYTANSWFLLINVKAK